MGPPRCYLGPLHCVLHVGGVIFPPSFSPPFSPQFPPRQISESIHTDSCRNSGVTLQVAAVDRAMFTVGRIITFGMTGMAIVVVPIYQAETSPEMLRGTFASTIQLMIILGQVVATCVTYGTKNIDSDPGWRIPTGLQLIIPAIILALLPLVPESPRWLLRRGRREEATKNLRKLRPGDGDDEIQLEIEALIYINNNEEKGTWSEVFNRTNRVSCCLRVKYGRRAPR